MGSSNVTQHVVSGDGKRLSRHARRELISSTALSLTLAIGVGVMMVEAKAQNG